jgi:hypothetical protein
MIVSLEQSGREASGDCRPAMADVKEEDRQDQELRELSHQILDLAKAIHAETPRPPAA